MKFDIDQSLKMATVFCSNTDKLNCEKSIIIHNFIAECREKRISVCIFESGSDDLIETTGELLTYNFNLNTAGMINLNEADNSIRA